MSDKQAFISILGGLLSAILGWFLGGLIVSLIIRDAGDDGVLIYMCASAVVFGVAGFAFSLKWVRKHVKAD
jgi:hypothetical protein